MPCPSTRGSGSAWGEWALASTLGRYRTNIVPWPTVLWTRTSPPDCFAKPKTWLNPRPVPWPTSLVVKNGSKMCSI